MVSYCHTSKAFSVVTGSTDGIGKGYAFELARRSMNVVLIARNHAKLVAVQREISESHRFYLSRTLFTVAMYPNVDVRTVVFDFSEHSTDAYERMYKESGLDKLDVGVLGEMVV